MAGQGRVHGGAGQGQARHGVARQGKARFMDYMRITDVATITGLKDNKIVSMMLNGKFPPPVAIGLPRRKHYGAPRPGRMWWKSADVLAWLGKSEEI